MKLSVKTEYGLRAMLELGKRYGQGLVQSRDVAQTRGIPESFVDRIMLTFRNRGLVQSVRGVNGGHALTREPKDVALLDIVEILEGGIAPADCVSSNASVTCPIAKSCVVKTVWHRMYKGLQDSIAGMTLADLVQCEQANRAEPAYHI